MNFFIVDFSQASTILDLIFAIVLFAVVFVLALRKINKIFASIFYPAIYIVIILGYIFQLNLLTYGGLAVFIIASVIALFVNASEYRYFIQKEPNLKNKKKDNSKDKQSIEDCYKIIAETVKTLSRTKTGALMTFEKNEEIDIKNGVKINAPVSQELLVTIFYPGTRLHDGAVVISGTEIVAASVFYTPTTRALAGKYGSRHRAAVGIAEVSDSVTVVVSEETGRISLAYKSRLEHTTADDFLNDFVDCMNAKD